MKLDNFCILPTVYGNFRMYDLQDENIRLLSYSPIEDVGENPLLRIHSSCIASEVFGARDCDCADQLKESMKIISSEGRGLIIHIHQEGRGHGLSWKIRAVSLMQKNNCDTVESFNRLGLELDPREYADIVKILKELNIQSVRLITNNPRKKDFLEKNGITVEIVHTHPKIRPENEAYLYSKNKKLGHSLPLDEPPTTEEIKFYHSDQKWGEFANYSNHAIFIDGKIWPTVEHFYQAQKFHGTEYEEFIRIQPTPMLAKQRAHEILEKFPALDWDKKKETIMYMGLEAKFTQHPELASLLLSTNNKELIEHSDKDKYWGDGGDGTGCNRLGRLLMRLRGELTGRDVLMMSLHKSAIQKFFNVRCDLQCLGSGAEGIVFTDGLFVYKSFFNISNNEWSFLKNKSECFGQNGLLYPISLYENEGFRFIRYEYQESTPLKTIDEDSLIDFLRFCKLNAFVFVNIKPKNFIQLKNNDVKLIDYGRSIKPYSTEELLNAAKRAFMMMKHPTMDNTRFQQLTNQINNGEIPPEIIGWENLWNKI